jgi:hypothetical protein
MAKWGTRFITENKQLSDQQPQFLINRILLHCIESAKSSRSIEEIRTYEEIIDLIKRELNL